MRLALSQMHVEPGQPQLNLSRAEQRIAAAATLADIVLLPEALDCGWTHPSARELAGPIPGGEACERLRAAARACGIHVCAGIVERSGDHLYNAPCSSGPAARFCFITANSTNSTSPAPSTPAETGWPSPGHHGDALES